MPQPNQIDQKLIRLHALQSLQPQDETPAMVKMLSELYGIKSQQELLPEQARLAAAHANYYEGMTGELSQSRGARAMQEEMIGLSHAYPNGIPDHIRDQVAKKYGYDTTPPAKPTVQGDYGPSTPTATPTAPLATRLGHAVNVIGGAEAATNPAMMVPYTFGKLYSNRNKILPALQSTYSDFMKGLTQ